RNRRRCHRQGKGALGTRSRGRGPRRCRRCRRPGVYPEGAAHRVRRVRDQSRVGRAMGILLDMPMMGATACWHDAESDPRAVGETKEALACFKNLLGDPWDGWGRGVPLAREFFMSFQGREPE